jgi:hypothetical protein
MTIRQLRLKHARALRELAAAYTRRRAAIIKAQKAQMRERLSHGPKSGSHGKSLGHSKKWHNLLSKPLISHNKKI